MGLANVLRGADWLDEVRPEWYQLVDIDTLQMSDSGNCILGQVFREEAAEAAENGETFSPSGWEYAPPMLIQDGYDWVWAQENATFLTSHAFVFWGHDEWVEQINARLINEALYDA